MCWSLLNIPILEDSFLTSWPICAFHLNVFSKRQGKGCEWSTVLWLVGVMMYTIKL